VKGSYLGEFEQIVLLAVAQLAQQGYGVTIQREIRRRTGRTPSLGAVYATLSRLEDKGYIASTLGAATAERGGRAKRLFELRPAGSRALRQTRRALDRMWDGVELEPGPQAR
jgi:DNA-binding PadR family transcriptional regulator